MKLENVAYCYRRNLDRWLIIFPTHAEAKAFETLYSDGKYKPTLSTYSKTITETETTRYRAIYAKLTGRFEQLRQLYKAKHKHDTIVDDLESDGTFDKIELIFDTESGIASFRIEKFETWTDWACKSILNSQFGMVAQANGYYDTDTVGQGGLCTRRSCCGIGIDRCKDKYGNAHERIIFTVKNFCRGEADIIKVSCWTNTFIGTNKENEKEYSWNDFKEYVQKLSATGSDIWDIEYEYDETCPMTGTEVADKLHVYLNPLAYKRLFEEEDKEKPMQILKNITDISSCMTKVLGCGTLYYYNLYFDDKSDLKNVNDKHINRSMLNSVKGTYYIRVVSYNKELPNNISSATLVWDQEENRYSVEDFTIKGYRKDDKKVWLSTGSLWSNDDYLARVKALTPPPLPDWMKQDDDHVEPTKTLLANLHLRIDVAKVKPTKILVQGTATIIWWSDGTKTVVKCQKGDKMDPEKGIAMCVMKKFMGTNETHSNYLDFAKPAIEEYERKQKAMAAARKKAADKKRRAAKKEEKGNAEA